MIDVCDLAISGVYLLAKRITSGGRRADVVSDVEGIILGY